jgi:hypothetical protein
MTNKTRKLASVIISLVVMLLAACATTSPPTALDEDAVEYRAQKRWDALLAGDYASAYAMYSPGYRSTASVTDFEIEIRLRRISWKSAEYKSHDCEGNKCTVVFTVGYQVAAPVPGVNVYNGYDLAEDQWIKTGGEWWYLPPER